MSLRVVTLTFALVLGLTVPSYKAQEAPPTPPGPNHSKGPASTTEYLYSILFRDHLHNQLSELGKQVYYASGIHPHCAARSGICIPRRSCIEKRMLYISTWCYHHDTVCCYDNNIYRPMVEVVTRYAPYTTTVDGTVFILRLPTDPPKRFNTTPKDMLEDGELPAPPGPGPATPNPEG